MEEQRTYKLIDPITLADKKYTELTVRRPRAKDLRGLVVGYSAIDLDMVLLGITRCVVGVLPAVVDELSLADLFELGKLVTDFLPSGMIPIGKQESET